MINRICPCRGCTAHPGSCPAITPGGRCPSCSATLDHARGTRQQRGYDAHHEAERARWARRLARLGTLLCARCLDPARPIRNGDPWDLGHTDDRTGYLGPEHPDCNRSAGGKLAHGG